MACNLLVNIFFCLLACDLRAHPPPRPASLRSRTGCKDNDQLPKTLSGASHNKVSRSRNQASWTTKYVILSYSLGSGIS